MATVGAHTRDACCRACRHVWQMIGMPEGPVSCPRCGVHVCGCGCGTDLSEERATSVYSNRSHYMTLYRAEGSTTRAARSHVTRTGVGSRGGNVRSVEGARGLQEHFKGEWTEKVRAHIAATLLATKRFHADDLQALEVPEAHSAVIGSQIASYVNRKLMVKVGERKCIHKAANGRKAAIYEITELGRKTLAGHRAEGRGQAAVQDPRPADATPSSVSGEDGAGVGKPQGPQGPPYPLCAGADSPDQLPGTEPNPYERLQDAA